MAFPHATAPSTHLAKIVELPAPPEGGDRSVSTSRKPNRRLVAANKEP
jgi:hypothetical protein